MYELASAQNNVHFHLGEKVEDVQISEEGVLVTTNSGTFRGQIVVGCDGAHSVLSKRLTGAKPNLHHHVAAVRAYYRNVTEIEDKTYELHFLKGVLPGYFWIFPLKDNLANVGLGLLSSEISKRKINLRESLDTIIKSNPAIAARFKDAEILGKVEGFGLPLGSQKVSVSGARFMLCGDAASLIDPATGEGIGQAMISGRYAAWQAKRCFEANDFSAEFMKGYDKQLYDKLWKQHRRRYFIRRWLLSNDWLLNGLVNLISKSKFLKKLWLKYVG